MTEQELRALVRDAVARHLGQVPAQTLSRVPSAGSRVSPGSLVGFGSRVPGPEPLSPSHAIYATLVNVGGECVIEPNVTCNHCNYCKSHGH
jgi:hypothetical protein